MYHVMDEDSPKGIWDKLANLYMSKSATNKVYLKQKFYGLKMQEGSDLVEHVNAFNQLVTDLARLDVKIEDEDKALLLVLLPPSYEHLVITLTHGKTTVNNKEVTAALLGHELRKQKNATEESTQGFGLAVKGYQLRNEQEAEKKKKKKLQCYMCKD